MSRLILIQTMTNTKKISITTESREIFVVRMREKSVIHGFCPQCAAKADFLTLDEAVCFSARTTREIVRQTETNQVHSVETASGHLFICQKSLEDFLVGEIK